MCHCEPVCTHCRRGEASAPASTSRPLPSAPVELHGTAHRSEFAHNSAPAAVARYAGADVSRAKSPLMTLFLVRDLLEAAVGLCGSTRHVPRADRRWSRRGHAGTLASSWQSGRRAGFRAHRTRRCTNTDTLQDGTGCGRRAFAHGYCVGIRRIWGRREIGRFGNWDGGADERAAPFRVKGGRTAGIKVDNDAGGSGVGVVFKTGVVEGWSPNRLHSPVSTSTSSPSSMPAFSYRSTSTRCLLHDAHRPRRDAVAVRHKPALGPVYLRPSTKLGVDASADARGASSTLPSLSRAPYPPANASAQHSTARSGEECHSGGSPDE
ncbi:hypothetical protein A0H81_10407 [Grifola frondosa]|uniref:Uncharacterized protein n=1 Tax=Grifola frondosa TaxID=5627 RepID=A0A1C7LYP9_GRIFR|nr:hypothetical protein A0H81_10407 [Grifola frondosa]